MKILFVTQNFWPENFIINDLVVELSKMGYTISVLTGYPNYPSGKIFREYQGKIITKEKFGDVEVLRVPMFANHSKSKLKRVLSYLSYMLSMSFFGLIYFTKDFDLIFTYQPGSILVGVTSYLINIRIKAKSVFWIQDLWPEAILAMKIIKPGKLEKLIKLVSNWIYGNNDLLLVQSEGLLSYLNKNRNIPDIKMKFIPNWSMDFSKVGFLEKVKFKLLYIGNIGHFQNIETLVEVAKELKDKTEIEFTIIGDGQNYSSVQELILEYHCDNVQLIQKSEYKNLESYLSEADVLYLQLISDPILSLTIPGKLQAYLCYGKPILGAVMGEAARIIQEADCGLIAKPLDIESQKEAILKMKKNNYQERYRLGNNGYKYYKKNFDRTKSIQRVNYILKELLA